MKVRAGWTDEEWDGLLAGRPDATFFHGRAWARILRESFPRLADRSLWIEEEPPLLLPLFAWKRAGGLLTTLHSSFPFLYGGPVRLAPAAASARGPAPAGDAAPPGGPAPKAARDPAGATPGYSPGDAQAGDAQATSASDDLLLRVFRELSREHPWASLRVTGNPFRSREDGEAAWSGAPAGGESTHLLRLPATEEEYWETVLTTAKRNDVRRLAKKGIAVEESRAEADVDAVYGLYTASFARWGGTPGMVYPRAFYRNLCRLGGDAVRFTVARHEGRVIGGTFAIRAFGKAHYLAGYFDHESRALRPNVLIQIDSIQAAIRSGLETYDFLPSGGHESVEAFKEGLGGKRAPFPVLARTGRMHRLLRRGGD